MSQSATFLDEPTPVLGDVFDSVLGAYRAEGFDAGYHRAVNDLLADFVLVAREFIRDQGDDSPELRQALREFQERFEKHLEQAASGRADQFVDGGLGI
jgi:predicted outer membrane protein